MGRYVIGVDVGTGSARAGVIDASNGRIIASSSHPIKLFNPLPEYYQQSSTDIWNAIKQSIEQATNQAKAIDADCLIVGLAFDATCSLVVIDENDQPLGVSPINQKNNQSTDEPEQNIIVWMDHRAHSETHAINQTNDPILKYVGNALSVEMELPKILWLKRHRSDTYSKARKFFDLADWLAYHATGVEARSFCTVGCKWTYAPSEDQQNNQSAEPQLSWSRSFFTQIGLEDHVADDFIRIGKSDRSNNQSNDQQNSQTIHSIGSPVGSGLSVRAAKELGLPVGLPVGVGLIDAHAGALAMAGATIDQASNQSNQPMNRLVIIAGTSSCHMFVSSKPVFVPGVWGPYYGAVLDKGWLNEGGQSSVGSLIDCLIDRHACGKQAREQAAKLNQSVHDVLISCLSDMAHAQGLSSFHLLTKDVHCLPYFHGNRSPRADASLTGIMTGQTLDTSINQLAISYLAAVQALAYGTRHILLTAEKHGVTVDCLMACGGLSKNRLFMQTHADACQRSIQLGREADAMLVGAAVAAAAAAGEHPSLSEAARAMSGVGEVIEPDMTMKDFHDRKFKVFLKMYDDMMEYRKIMDS